MNLLLFEADELDGDRLCLSDRRAEHLRQVLGVRVGQSVRLGRVGGGIGDGRVLAVDPRAVVLEVGDLDGAAPRSRVDLVLALPRPQALKRILEYAAMMGVDRIDLIRTWRVEKSFFHSPLLAAERLRKHLLLGAEQGMTTHLPEVRIHTRFKPFVDRLTEERRAPQPEKPLGLLAHPEAPGAIEDVLRGAAAGRGLEIAIGPEGGWIDREVESFVAAGFRPVKLGPWILRVETALAAMLAQIELLRRLRVD